jgi:hypothetical protein
MRFFGLVFLALMFLCHSIKTNNGVIAHLRTDQRDPDCDSILVKGKAAFWNIPQTKDLQANYEMKFLSSKDSCATYKSGKVAFFNVDFILPNGLVAYGRKFIYENSTGKLFV